MHIESRRFLFPFKYIHNLLGTRFFGMICFIMPFWSTLDAACLSEPTFATHPVNLGFI